MSEAEKDDTATLLLHECKEVILRMLDQSDADKAEIEDKQERLEIAALKIKEQDGEIATLHRANEKMAEQIVDLFNEIGTLKEQKVDFPKSKVD